MLPRPPKSTLFPYTTLFRALSEPHLVKIRVAMQCCDMTKRSKKAWTKWRRLVSEHARSGQSVKVFCREHGFPDFLSQCGIRQALFDPLWQLPKCRWNAHHK